ncbi:J domain-containing protein [Streptomyces mexicanus]|jgi:curved DNA-binding protein CbpA|uniref:J domain-containing protein n=1 Tax=Streptomyces mexicanus TaxID=178566 RepID=A0A7X1HXC8_9ACTN|nr:J domain-containing protein [Streptomyces mexicanus]MBC2864751.1 J domain-containing protein [Streptomyces mexicanus]
MEVPDLYAVLGVEPSATAQAITSAFRRRVRELRPDTRVDADTARRFGQVRAAYETLRDPVRRSAYDRTRAPAPGGTAGADRLPPRPAPGRRGVVLGDPPAEPPLRAGPVRWERPRRS